MVTGDFTTIRLADLDDAPSLRAFYDPLHPRSSLLDGRREFFLPSLDELREAMSHKETGRTAFSVIEDKTGDIRGFCSLRAINAEAGYAEIVLLLREDTDYASPLASEAMTYLITQAFQRMQLHKILTHCLDCETHFRECTIRHGFRSEGSQREVVYMGGRWMNVEALSLFRAWTPYGKENTSAGDGPESATKSREATWR